MLGSANNFDYETSSSFVASSVYGMKSDAQLGRNLIHNFDPVKTVEY